MRASRASPTTGAMPSRLTTGTGFSGTRSRRQWPVGRSAASWLLLKRQRGIATTTGCDPPPDDRTTRPSMPALSPPPSLTHVPDARGRFGLYGGQFVPETLMAALEQLQFAYADAKADPAF